MSYYVAPALPTAFIWRRLHSLTGFFLTLFLFEHLFLNSQAAVVMGDDGRDFVRGVDAIQNLPYLRAIEILLLGIPFLIHGWFGVRYLFTAKYNSFPTDGSSPSLGQYALNHAYTWQRFTSWLLLVGIVAHVVHMRWIEYPASARLGTQSFYMIPVKEDVGLYPLSKQLGFELYDQKKIQEVKTSLYAQQQRDEREWLQALETHQLQAGQLLAIAPSFGMAELLMVRETFKSPLMMALYSLLVLATCFHAFNGLWTFMISWGVTLTRRSQQLMRYFAMGLMGLVIFFGLAAIYGSYLFN